MKKRSLLDVDTYHNSPITPEDWLRYVETRQKARNSKFYPIMFFSSY
jgi:hypothetical protein